MEPKHDRCCTWPLKLRTIDSFCGWMPEGHALAVQKIFGILERFHLVADPNGFVSPSEIFELDSFAWLHSEDLWERDAGSKPSGGNWIGQAPLHRTTTFQ